MTEQEFNKRHKEALEKLIEIFDRQLDMVGAFCALMGARCAAEVGVPKDDLLEATSDEYDRHEKRVQPHESDEKLN